MKRKIISLLLGATICAMCLAGCTTKLESPIIPEDETESVAEIETPSNTESPENKTEESVENSDSEEVTEESTDTDSETNTDTTNKESESASKENAESKNEEEKEYDPYAGLAVARCHSVTLPMGTSYNDAIAEVTKGTSAYPDTFPNIYGANLDVPGVYTCYWEQKQADGTWLPLNYAVFTVTIYDPNPPVVTPPTTE